VAKNANHMGLVLCDAFNFIFFAVHESVIGLGGAIYAGS